MGMRKPSPSGVAWIALAAVTTLRERLASLESRR